MTSKEIIPLISQGEIVSCAKTDRMVLALELSLIRIDGDTQLRSETKQDVIQNYAQDMLDGDIFPPVVVFNDGTNYWLSDGFHRFFAVKEAHKEEILADVRQGTRRDALLHAAEANRKHGQPLNNKDKRRVVTLFLNDPEWSKWSDREIARRCGVSNNFVSSLRSTLSSDDSNERTYVTKYGTTATMNVARIGNDPFEGLSEYIVKELQEDYAPSDSIAEIARYAREVKADIKGNAGKALLIGGWMLHCKEGGTPRIGDPPYTQEQLEKEGWGLWCLAPQDLETAFTIGELERSWHKTEELKGKDFFDITDEDMLSNASYETTLALANWFAAIMFRMRYTIWHYVSLGMSKEQKDKIIAEGEAMRAERRVAS